jgi:hypothetical protein
MFHPSRFLIALFLGLLSLSGRLLAAPAETDEPHSYCDSLSNTGSISAPVAYKGLMLIAVSADGVAAIVFDDPIDRGRKYRFRFLPKDGTKEIEGSGEIFERYTDGHYDGGKLTIRAGRIAIGWSAGGDDSGWIYYEPEKIRLQIACAKRFKDSTGAENFRNDDVKKIDLKRFLHWP